MAVEPQPPVPSVPDRITDTYDPDIEKTRVWLEKMIAELRFLELVVAVVALIARLRSLNTELMRRLTHLTRKRPPSETLRRLENQLALPFPGMTSPRPNPRTGGRGRKRRRGKQSGRRAFPAYMERVPEENKVPEGMRDCPDCGKPLVALGNLGHTCIETLEVRPAEVYVSVRHDETLWCPTDGIIVSAPPPDRIVPRGVLGDTFIIEALADKYLLHVPIERQCLNWLRQGVDIAPQTLGRSVAAAIDMLGPVASVILEQMRRSGLLSIDATGIRLLDPEAPDGRRYGTIWCGIGDGCFVGFIYQPNGDTAGARLFLDIDEADDLTSRIIQCDATTVLNFIERQGGRRPGCWSHARRRLVEAARSGDYTALDGLRIIAKIFLVEKISAAMDETPHERKARREEQSRTFLDELRTWVDSLRGFINPKSPLGNALGYMHRQWSRLTLFVEEGRVEATNNGAERALRTLVIGLKNWLFVYKDEGAKRAAIILTVLGTCVAQRVNPRAFLHKALGLLVHGVPQDQMHDLLPDRLAERFPELRMPSRASPAPDELSLAEQIAELEEALAQAQARALPPAAQPQT